MAYPSTSTLRSWWAPACRGPWAKLVLNGAGVVYIRPAIVEATKALNEVLKAYGYVTRSADTGAYNCREITGGGGYSLHSYGIAIDINWQSNPYGSRLVTDMRNYGDGRMPDRIEDIRTKNGKQVWRWGGYYSGNKDAMHYEIVCTPSDIYTGIDWSTVYGGVKEVEDMTPTELVSILRSEGISGAADVNHSTVDDGLDVQVKVLRRNQRDIADFLNKIAAHLGMSQRLNVAAQDLRLE